MLITPSSDSNAESAVLFHLGRAEESTDTVELRLDPEGRALCAATVGLGSGGCTVVAALRAGDAVSVIATSSSANFYGGSQSFFTGILLHVDV